MSHWDFPVEIQNYGGFLNSSINWSTYFSDYDDLLFCEYGEKVKRWVTFIEPLHIVSMVIELS